MYTKEMIDEFEKFMETWDESFDLKGPKMDANKSNKWTPRNDGHSMLNDLDKYLPPEEDYIPHNVWEFLLNKGYKRVDVDYIGISYDNTKNIIDELEVTLVTGVKLNFDNIVLKGD